MINGKSRRSLVEPGRSSVGSLARGVGVGGARDSRWSRLEAEELRRVQVKRSGVSFLTAAPRANISGLSPSVQLPVSVLSISN